MDVAGIVVQLSLLLVALGGRINQAIEQHKGLTKELKKFRDEVDATKSIVDLVQKEPALQDAEAVHTAIQRLRTLAETLDTQIRAMSKKRGTVRGVSHQLTHGAAEQQSLIKITDQLVRAKQNLEVHIQLAHVGLTREARDAIVINTLLVQRIDRAVQRALGSGRSLAIAAFVKAKLKEQRPNADGMLQLPLAEFEAFEQERVKRPGTKQTAIGETNGKKRITSNCFSTGDSLQLNAPFQEDLWKDKDVVKTDGCFSTERSIQVNYMQTGDTLQQLLRAREISLTLQQRT